MSEVGAYEARTHLSKLLERVEKGERIVITKHGRPVAELVPIRKHGPAAIHRAIEDLKAFAVAHSLKGLKLKDLVEEGRR